MTDHFHRLVHQQSLLQAWTDVRAGLQPNEARVQEFERHAAKNLAAIGTALEAGTWRPQPVRPVQLPRSDGTARTLGIGPFEDRIVERALLRVLDPVIDPELLPFSYAYRRGLGAADAIRALVEARDAGNTWVARMDIDDCFASIPRRPVLTRLADLVADDRLLAVVRLLVNRRVRGRRGSATRGLHQGSPLSPLLANLYLDQLDRSLLDRGIAHIRYADDIVMPAPDRVAAEDALRKATQLAIGLRLAPDAAKSAVTSFDDGVAFLGDVVTSRTQGTLERSSHPVATTVYVTHQGALIRSKGSRVRVQADGQTQLSLDLRRVRQVVCLGRVGMTSAFLHQCLRHGVEIVLLDSSGRYDGRVHRTFTADPGIRRAQYQVADDPDRALEIARSLVRGKIANLRTGVLRAARHRPLPGSADIVRRLDSGRRRCAEAPSIASLMGHEGTASRDYFAALATIIGPEWSFTARRRRPPPDPINSMLSFGYTLLLNDVAAALEIAGLDPACGFLHAPHVNRPNLALDLIEEFRPVIVDSVVIRLVRTGAVTADDFQYRAVSQGPPACTLSDAARRTFLAAYERRMLTLFTHAPADRKVSYRAAVGVQATQLADLVRGRIDHYTPTLWK